ncbi:hypothetical protein DXB46_10705 [Lachnospiraceae bacterium OM04-12BH]|nr:hypothetical protein DXB46_10705 [Lachnospiraceae bacterium OM04-12BH]
MIYHAHMYYIISDSGLASDKKIQRSKGNFFNPIHVLRDKFKSKYFYHLNKLYLSARLCFPKEKHII